MVFGSGAICRYRLSSKLLAYYPRCHLCRRHQHSNRPTSLSTPVPTSLTPTTPVPSSLSPVGDSSKIQNCDVVIVGGGMVGNAFAASLAQSRLFANKNIVLLEADLPFPLPLIKRAESATNDGGRRVSNRVSAISPSSMKLLQDLNVWSTIVEYGAQPVTELQVMDSHSNSHIHFEASKDIYMNVAFIVENNIITGTLMQLLDELKQRCTVITKAKVTSCFLPMDLSSPASITLEDGRIFNCELVVAADGANSLVRRSMHNNDCINWDYDQKAIVATLNLAEPCSNTVAFQRFSKLGPIAMLPLNSTKSSLVWTTSSTECERLMASSDELFTDQLNTAMWTEEDKDDVANRSLSLYESVLDRLLYNDPMSAVQLPPTIVSIDANSRACFPLGFGHSSRYIGPRVALIGDAAHRVHPLAGQGVNMGFGDVTDLKRSLERAITNGADLGSLVYLRDYESIRLRQNCPIMFAIDGLNRLYTKSWTPIVALRSIGLTTVNRIPQLKFYLLPSDFIEDDYEESFRTVNLKLFAYESLIFES